MLKPFPWPAEKLSTNYCVGVGVKGMRKIEKAGQVYEYLEEHMGEVMGVKDVYYVFHADPFVYFSVVSNCDNKQTHTKILEVIKGFISDD